MHTARRKRPARLILAILIILAVCFSRSAEAQAARGIPGSAEFAYGAVLHLNGPFLRESLSAAAELQLDWIYVPISWAAIQPEAESAPRFEALAPVMLAAEQQQIPVAVSIENAPFWAQTTEGPDPARTAQFARLLVERYPRAVQAVEIFPGANKGTRWGAQPNPRQYMAVFQQVNDLLGSGPYPVLLVGGGIQPVPNVPSQNDMNDLEFLEELYQLGAASQMPVISMQLLEYSGEPVTLPYESGYPVLRHYEKVRDVMIKNHHRNGMIWITRFHLPSSKIVNNHTVERDLNAQAAWMSRVHLQLRAQLYIGAIYLQNLNPELEGAAAQIPSLIRGTGDRHPFFAVFKDMIRSSKTAGSAVMPGRPKDGNLMKQRP
jgi:hypothetical protein